MSALVPSLLYLEPKFLEKFRGCLRDKTINSKKAVKLTDNLMALSISWYS
ncbi:hypothetical protein LguiB_017528 [Lonicera macranthoides]